jgi:hypothetical protein
MMAVYRVQFAYPRTSEAKTVLESQTPICLACAAGHHEQPVLVHESCDCPCHGTPLESAGNEVAA